MSNGDVFRAEKYSFVLLNISSDLIKELTEIFDIDVSFGLLRESSVPVAVISMYDESNIDKIIGAIEHLHLDESTYEIRISLVTESDSDGLSVPDFITHLHRRIGGHISFSYVLV